MNIGAWIAFGGLLAVILVQTAAIAFYLGGLSTRVMRNTDDIKVLKEGEDTDGVSRNSIALKMAALETRLQIELEHLTKSNDQLTREMRGLSRQVASLVTSGRPGSVPPLMDAQAD